MRYAYSTIRIYEFSVMYSLETMTELLSLAEIIGISDIIVVDLPKTSLQMI